MSFPRYLLSKESGLAWLGQIPDHWGVGQSRRLFAVRNEGAHATDKQLTASQEYGVIYQEDFVQREGRRVVQVILGADILKHVEPGDFVISMRSFQGGIEFCPLRGCISSAYVMLSPVQPVHRPFFKYLFKSKPYIQALQLTSNLVRDGQALRFDNFAQVSLPLVPLSEQVAIAAILDRETAKIDDLVKEQQRLIELLKEKRQAAISQAVTKGLNPNVPMKDSGVKWLGKVPAHWTVCALRRVIAAIEQGWSPECESAPADDQSWGVLKAGCVNRGVFDPSENKALPDELAPIAEYEVSSGDVLVSRASGSPELVGSTALVGETRGKLMLSDKIFRVHLVPRMTSPFFVWAMNGRALRDQIERALSGGNGRLYAVSCGTQQSHWAPAGLNG
jgi:type I restriction enzyme, S subunit